MKLLLTAFLFALSLTAHSQEGVIVRIVDQLSEEPLAQASAHLTTDTAGATTNTMGYLQIAATPGDSLVLTAPGYLPGVVVVPEVANPGTDQRAVESGVPGAKHDVARGF